MKIIVCTGDSHTVGQGANNIKSRDIPKNPNDIYRTEGKGISRELGTRHRAALGITETTDAISLIVSEETGIISMARGGRLTRHLDRAALEEILNPLYLQQETSLWASLMDKTRRRKGGAA